MHFRDDRSRAYTALMSKVMVGRQGPVKLPINAAGSGKKKSRSTSTGVLSRARSQHIAMATDDIVASVDSLRAGGSGSIRVPGTYYAARREKSERSRRSGRRRAAEIPGRRAREGYLLQIFTKNVRTGHRVLRDHRAARVPRVRPGQHSRSCSWRSSGNRRTGTCSVGHEEHRRAGPGRCARVTRAAR